jgi:hypothetical protein
VLPLHIAWRTRHVGLALQWFLDTLLKNEQKKALTVGL